jgi:predicted permease
MLQIRRVCGSRSSTASMTAIFAVQYKVYVAESDATILLSSVLSIATLGVCIALTA